MKYFAYGSNMNLNRLQARVPTAIKIGTAVLKGYFFKCNKISIDQSSKGNIIQTGNDTDQVWGVIFDIADREKPSLDQAEGLGSGYNELEVELTLSTNETTTAKVYIADNNRINDNLLPYDWYKQFIVTGAIKNDLPKEYIKKLEAMEFQKDLDLARRSINFGIISGIQNTEFVGNNNSQL